MPGLEHSILNWGSPPSEGAVRSVSDQPGQRLMMKAETLRVRSTQTMQYVGDALGKLTLDRLYGVVDKVRYGLN